MIHGRGIIKIFEGSDWKDLKIIMLRKDSSFQKTEEQSKSDEKSFKRNKNLAINAKKKIEKHWYRGKGGVRDVSLKVDVVLL